MNETRDSDGGTTILADRYVLEGLLGSGGMSRVVAARDRMLGRRVAVKLLRDDLAADPVVRERLLREARATASFTHPNAVAVYDVGEADGRPFIVMELVEGRTLTAILRERGPLPVGESVHIADAVLAALEAAHARGLVHRDVKPGNILIDPGGEVKLADFGIAKVIAEGAAALTATGEVVGTPRYLAPEQAAGAQADERSDLYAAGIVCYEMLTGEPPFTGPHAVAILLAHQRQPVPALVDYRPDVPPTLAAVVHQALEKDPARRFASATAMRDALRRTAGMHDAALPPSAGAQASTAAAPTRRALSVVAFAALALLGVLFVTRLSGTGDQAAEPPPATVEESSPGAGAVEDDDGPEAEDGDNAPDATSTASPQAAEPPQPEARLQALIADLSDGDDERFGEKTGDLLEDLEDIVAEGDRRTQADEARDLMSDIEKWVADDELDADMGARALEALDDFLLARRDAEG